MLQMKSPMALRARLIHQVRAVGRIASYLGFASVNLFCPWHGQCWGLETVPCLLWFGVASVVLPSWPWLMGFSWPLQDLRMGA